MKVAKDIRNIRDKELHFGKIMAGFDAVCKALLSNMSYSMSFIMFVFKIYYEDESLNKA